MGKTEYTMTAIFTSIGAIFTVIAISVESVVAKWIWGILAASVFIFTVYAIIDAIVKSRRKPKNFAELLMNYIEEEAKKPDFKENLTKKMESMANRRDVLFDGQRPNDTDYGYSLNNPIMTSTISYSDRYLAKLRTLDGQKFTWNRNGSHCVREISGIENVMVDEYQLYLGGVPFKTIYICPYGHSGSFVPKGLKLNDEESELEKEAREKGISVEDLKMIKKIEDDHAKEKAKERRTLYTK